MDHEPSRGSPPTRSPLDPPRAPDLGALVALLGLPGEAPALEQALVDLAVSSAGAGFERAWLLSWRAGSERLEEGCRAREGARAEPGPMADGPHGRLPFAVSPACLDPVTSAAWGGGGVRVGEPLSVGMPWQGSALVGAVAVRRGGRRWGLLVGSWRPGGDGPSRAGSLGALAALAERSFDLHDRVAEARRREEQAVALAELARGVGDVAHLAEAFHLAVRLAAHGPATRRERAAQALLPLATEAMTTRAPLVLERVTDDPRLSAEDAASLTTVLVVPCVMQGRALGALAVYDVGARRSGTAPGYDAGDVQFLCTLAALLGATADQARSHSVLREGEHRLRELRARLTREERLASLGENALRTAREARNPLASIAAFARRVQRAMPESDPQRESLEIVMREVGRLERLMEETLAEAPPEPARLTVESVNQSVQAVLQTAGETLVRRRVRLLKKLAPDLPALLLDAERVRRVLGNVLAYALDAVPVGGRVRVESRRAGSNVLVEIAHDGPRAPGDLIEQLFVSLASGSAPDGGIGLGVAQRIIREHGGELRVRAEGEWTTVVSLTLPVDGNQDRRRPATERRQRRPDRRRAAGA